jgi:dihydroneopterin aldolase
MSIPVDGMKILIRDLRLSMSIGIYDHEKSARQEVLVNIEADIIPPADASRDNMDDWVSYETAVRTIQALAADGHINLLETFATQIADALTQDKRVSSVLVRLEKTGALPETRSVGVEIRRKSGALA